MQRLIVIAGWGQLGLAAASLAIPKALKWREDMATVRTLTRRVFWTYAAYIWMTHICFGCLSVLRPEVLLDGTLLGGLVAAFMTLWWGARLVIQFLVFDRSARPEGTKFLLGELGLVVLFCFNTVVYGFAAFRNLKGM